MLDVIVLEQNQENLPAFRNMVKGKVTYNNRFNPYAGRPHPPSNFHDKSTNKKQNLPSKVVTKQLIKKSEQKVTFEFTVGSYCESEIKPSTRLLRFNEGDYIGFEVLCYKGKRYTDYSVAKEKLLSLEGTSEEDIEKALKFYCKIYTEKNIGDTTDISKFQIYLSKAEFKILNFTHFLKMFKFILLYCKRGNK